MRVAIVVEHLQLRDHYLEMIEEITEIFDDVGIFALSFNFNLITSLKNKPIQVSFLNNFRSKFFKFLTPNAVNSFKIPQEVELIICFSRGYVHGLRIPNKKIYNYIYDWSARNIEEPRWASDYLKRWRIEKLKTASSLVFSSDSLLKEINFKGSVFHPPFFSHHYENAKLNTVKVEDRKYYLVSLDTLTKSSVELIKSVFDECKIPFLFAGEANQIEDIKSSSNLDNSLFVECKCHGEFSDLLLLAKGYLDFSDKGFPEKHLAALFLERPIIFLNSALLSELLLDPQNVGVGIPNLDYVNLKTALKKIDGFFSFYPTFSLKKVALTYHSSRFKNHFVNNLQKA